MADPCSAWRPASKRKTRRKPKKRRNVSRKPGLPRMCNCSLRNTNDRKRSDSERAKNGPSSNPESDKGRIAGTQVGLFHAGG